MYSKPIQPTTPNTHCLSLFAQPPNNLKEQTLSLVSCFAIKLLNSQLTGLSMQEVAHCFPTWSLPYQNSLFLLFDQAKLQKEIWNINCWWYDTKTHFSLHGWFYLLLIERVKFKVLISSFRSLNLSKVMRLIFSIDWFFIFFKIYSTNFTIKVRLETFYSI